MKLVIYFLCLVGYVLAKPVNDVSVLKYDVNNDGLGTYDFNYELSDGSFRKEEGVLMNPHDPEHSYIAVKGSFGYKGPDGVVYTVKYVADEGGYQPEAAHLPSSSSFKSQASPRIDERFSKFG